MIRIGNFLYEKRESRESIVVKDADKLAQYVLS